MECELIRMMPIMFRTRSILGLAVDERSILAAELRIDRGTPKSYLSRLGNPPERYELRRTAEFVFPENVSFDEPAKLGQLLRQFLRENRFSAKVAVVGIPAKWLIAREKTIPPASPDSLAGILEIQAERDFSLDFKDLVFDYSGEVSSTEGSHRRVLLVATRRKTMEQIIKTAQAAGLSVRSVTLSCLALACSPAQQSSANRGPLWYGLYMRPDYAEFLVQNGKYLQLIKHLPITISSQKHTRSEIETFAVEIQRLLSFLPHEYRTPEPYKLILWDAAGHRAEAIEELNECLRPEVEVLNGSEDLSDAGDVSDKAEMNHFKAAAALARLGVTATRNRQGGLAIDFLNPHIRPKKRTVHKRQILWAAAVGITLLLCSLFVFWDWQKDKQEVAALTQHLEDMREDIEAAESVVQKVSFARGWYSERPRFLGCLRELTLAFPQEPTIWVTSLAIRENMQGIITGKSVDESSVLEVLDMLKQSSFFSDVQMLYMRDAGRNSKEVSFAVNFTFMDLVSVQRRDVAGEE